ncbi:MAG: glycosyltransferase [Propionibacteriaceae bacterium]|nr:glycosyltransferase [Propionibacteriaceae bacterium]
MLEALRECLPDTDLWVLWNDDPQRFATAEESWLARTPLRGRRALSLPLMPFVWRSVKGGRDYDWVLASTHLFAHHVRVRRQPLRKLAYVHTPARYIWAPEVDARGDGLVVRMASSSLRWLDRRRAQELYSIAANSSYIRDRIQRSWGRDSRVIYPPVNVEAIIAEDDWTRRLSDDELRILDFIPKEFVLGASRFVPYKRLDAAVRVGEILGLPVVLAGQGPDEARLRDFATASGIPVQFVTRPSTPLLYALFQRAQLYVFFAVEDFGIMPVEAMAAGTPVLANSLGGAGESVLTCRGGAVVRGLDSSSVLAAMGEISGVDGQALRGRTTMFSRERFGVEISDWLHEVMDGADG